MIGDSPSMPGSVLHICNQQIDMSQYIHRVELAILPWGITRALSLSSDEKIVITGISVVPWKKDIITVDDDCGDIELVDPDEDRLLFDSPVIYLVLAGRYNPSHLRAETTILPPISVGSNGRLHIKHRTPIDRVLCHREGFLVELSMFASFKERTRSLTWKSIIT